MYKTFSKGIFAPFQSLDELLRTQLESLVELSFYRIEIFNQVAQRRILRMIAGNFETKHGGTTAAAVGKEQDPVAGKLLQWLSVKNIG